jgi:hypothetical protein
MRWLLHWWWSRQRAIDLQILWPQCKKIAPDLDHAKAAFMVHAANDPAWARYYGEKLLSIVDKLT